MNLAMSSDEKEGPLLGKMHLDDPYWAMSCCNIFFTRSANLNKV